MFDPKTLPKMSPLIFVENSRPPVLLWFPANCMPVHQCTNFGAYEENDNVYMLVEEAEKTGVLYQSKKGK